MAVRRLKMTTQHGKPRAGPETGCSANGSSGQKKQNSSQCWYFRFSRDSVFLYRNPPFPPPLKKISPPRDALVFIPQRKTFSLINLILLRFIKLLIISFLSLLLFFLFLYSVFMTSTTVTVRVETTEGGFVNFWTHLFHNDVAECCIYSTSLLKTGLNSFKHWLPKKEDRPPVNVSHF
jgi:hypothetical protein